MAKNKQKSIENDKSWMAIPTRPSLSEGLISFIGHNSDRINNLKLSLSSDRFEVSGDIEKLPALDLNLEDLSK